MKENLVGELNESPISRLVKISDSRMWCRMTSQHTIGGRGADGIAMCHRGGATQQLRRCRLATKEATPPSHLNTPQSDFNILLLSYILYFPYFWATVLWLGDSYQTVNVLIVDLELVYWGRILKSCIPSLPTRKEATKALVQRL
ncbi:unnamed protein product [Prunus armeniaca]